MTLENWRCLSHAGFQCGRWWGLKPPRSVISHTVLIPGAFARTLFQKVAGWYHWKVPTSHYERYLGMTECMLQ